MQVIFNDELQTHIVLEDDDELGVLVLSVSSLVQALEEIEETNPVYALRQAAINMLSELIAKIDEVDFFDEPESTIET